MALTTMFILRRWLVPRLHRQRSATGPLITQLATRGRILRRLTSHHIITSTSISCSISGKLRYLNDNGHVLTTKLRGPVGRPRILPTFGIPPRFSYARSPFAKVRHVD